MYASGFETHELVDAFLAAHEAAARADSPIAAVEAADWLDALHDPLVERLLRCGSIRRGPYVLTVGGPPTGPSIAVLRPAPVEAPPIAAALGDPAVALARRACLGYPLDGVDWAILAREVARADPSIPRDLVDPIIHQFRGQPPPSDLAGVHRLARDRFDRIRGRIDPAHADAAPTRPTREAASRPPAPPPADPAGEYPGLAAIGKLWAGAPISAAEGRSLAWVLRIFRAISDEELDRAVFDPSGPPGWLIERARERFPAPVAKPVILPIREVRP